MKKTIFLLFFLFFINSIAIASKKIDVITVKGYGITYRESIQNALIEALKQSGGVKIDSKKSFIKNIKEKAVLQEGKSSHSISIGERSQSLVKEATEGIIHEYRVVDSRQTNDTEWYAKLKVRLVQYETPGISPHNRRKLAVIPFQSPHMSFAQPQGRVTAQEVSQQLAQKVITEMTQARRFTVLDREYVREYMHEKQLLFSGDAPVEEQMRLGEVLGVDYLIVGTISNYQIEKTSYTIEVTGEKGYDLTADLKADYRIIVMATRQIKWSDSIHVHLSNTDLQGLQSQRISFVQEELIKQGAQNIAHSSLANIYPLRIVQVNNQRVVLNQGGVTLQAGDICNVFQPGQKARDPYTGESLGRTENLAGRIQIQRVTAKKSYAKLVEGDSKEIEKGYICRRVAPEQEAGAQEQREGTDVQTTSDGGVVLPFD